MAKQNDHWCVSRFGWMPCKSSPVGYLLSFNLLFIGKNQMTPNPFNRSLHPLQDGNPPLWASGWGQDDYGIWVEFKHKEVTQRMRWIEPGEFVMGSPEDEAGRYKDESPQHQVVHSEGYWLFDTAVTQALWQAVMANNPSEFKSADRPVERVTWQDSIDFIEKINGLIPALQLSLPSESQWEYACRAGTNTALYTGDIEIIGECNAPALDAIAWYAGNSGEEFELDKGYDSSDWKEKQYPHTKAGTHPVAKKSANPWGLYDMLGNVWEWT
jgi:sulfatase modifying factor 1